jgi:hypothetical protein
MACSNANRLPCDPLFHFCEAMDGNNFESFGESVNVSALIAARGALEEAMTHRVPLSHHWQVAANNTRTLADWFEGNAWSPIQYGDLQSGILLLQHRKPLSSDHTRLRFVMAQSGIVASAFPGSLVRLSMPRFTLPLNYMTLLLKGLSSLSN